VTSENLAQLSATWEERFNKIEQFRDEIKAEFEEIKRALHIM